MTTWNPSDKDASVTLSGSDLIASVSSPNDGGVRGTTSKNSGKNSYSVSGDWLSGVPLAGVALAAASRTFGDANGVGLNYIPGFGWIAISDSTTVAGPDAGSPAPNGTDTIVVNVDSGANVVYFSCNGNNLLGGNPVAGTGGISIPSGSLFPQVSIVGPSGTSSVTADFTPGSLPSGFSDWDGGGGGSPYTLTADKGTFTTTGQVANLTVGPSWTYIGKTEATVSASGNYTLTEPSGAQQNDILVVDFATRSNVIYTNSDWTFPQSDTSGNTTNNTTGSIVSYQTGYCIRGSSAPSYVFNRTGGSRCLGTVRAYRSSRAGTPSFDTSAELAMGSAGTALTLTGGVTTTGIDELIVTGVYGARANTVSAMDGVTEVTGASGATDTTTPPTLGTWIERSDRNNGTSPTVALACYDAVKRTAGSTGNLTATQSQSARHGMVAMAFKHPAPAGGGSYTLTADKGTFTTTGVAAGLKRGLNNVVSAGTFAITGQTAGLKVGKKVTAGLGSYSISGQIAGFKRTYAVQVNQGTFSLFGQIANLKVGRVTTVGTGSIAINGVSANFNRGYGLQAGQGSISLTGVAAGFKRTYSLQAGTGSVAISGQNVVLRTTLGVIGERGIFTLGGQTAVLRAARKLACAQGSVSLTGQAADLVYTPAGNAYTLTAGTGVYNINGQPVSLRVAAKVVAQTGVYSVNGQSVGLRAGKKLISQTGVFSITGQPVTLKKTSVTGHETGQFNINGVQASLQVSKKVSAGLGSYTLSGKAVDFILGATGSYEISAEKGTILLSGKDVNLSYSPKVGGIGLRPSHGIETNKKDNPLKFPQFPDTRDEQIKQSATILARSGGHARAKNLTASQRVSIARIAARARWR